MPKKPESTSDEFSKEQKKFTKSLGSLNKSLSSYTKGMDAAKKEHITGLKKTGAINKKVLQDHTKETVLATKRLKSGAINSEISISTKGLDKTVKGLNNSTSKLVESNKVMESAAMNMSNSTKDLSASMDEFSENNEKTYKKFSKSLLMTTAKISAVALPLAAIAGYGAYKAGKYVGGKALRAGTAPIRGAGRMAGAVMEAPVAAGREYAGDIRGEIKSSVKKTLGIGLAAGTMGLAPGLMTQSLFSGRPAEDKESTSRMSEGIGKIADFFVGAGKKVGKGAMHVGRGIMNVRPDPVFTENLKSLDQGIGDTSFALEEMQTPDHPMYMSPSKEMKKTLEENSITGSKIGPILADAITKGMGDSGKKGIFGKSLESVFGIGATIGYVIPIFGAAYKAQLPKPGKFGVFGAMLKTLGLIYVANRSASHEVNNLILQQSKLLQIGFEIPGTLKRPGPRSLSEWMGQAIGDKLGGEGGPFSYLKDMVTGKIKGLFGNLLGFGKGDKKGGGLLQSLIPGYGDWQKKKEEATKEEQELKRSPSLVKRIELLTDIRDILKTELTLLNERMTFIGESAKVEPIDGGIPKLKKALLKPHLIKEGGLAFVDKGEIVGKFAEIKKGVGDSTAKIKESIVEMARPTSEKIKEGYQTQKENIFKKVEPIRDKLKTSQEEQTEAKPKKGFLGSLMGGAGAIFSGLFGGIKSFFKKMYNAIVDIPGKITDGILHIWDTYIKPSWNAPMNTIVKIFTDIRGFMSEKYQNLKGGISDVWVEGIKPLWMSMWDKINEWFDGGFRHFLERLPKMVLKSVNDIAKRVSEELNKETGEGAGSIMDVIRRVYQDTIPETVKSGFTESFKIVKTTLYTIVHGFSDILLTIDDLKNDFLEIGSTIIKPFKEIWGSDESFAEKLKKSLKEIPGTLITVGKGLIKGMKSTGKAIMGLIRPLGRVFLNLTGLAFELTMLLRRTFVKLRKAVIKKFLPSKWYEIYDKIEDRLTDIHFMSMNLMSSVLGSITSIGKTFKENVEEETEKGKKGIPLFLSEVVGTMKDTVMKAITPITSLLGNVWENIKSFGSMIKEMSEGPASKLKNFVSSFAEQVKTLGGNTKDFVLSIGKMTSDITEFSLAKLQKPVTAMAKGGLIYAANGIVVGEAGPEAVLPLDDPRATDRVAGMFSRAFEKLGFTKDKTIGDNFQSIVINRLDTIVSLLGGVAGKDTGGKPGILGKIAGGITDLTFSIASLPVKIMSGIAKGFGQMISGGVNIVSGIFTTINKGIQLSIDVAKFGFSGMRRIMAAGFKTIGMGLTAVKNMIGAGFKTLGFMLKSVWGVITAPFKAIKNLIFKPFRAISEKLKSVKEVSKKLIHKIKGEHIVAGTKSEPVYAKWPGTIIDLLKQIVSGDIEEVKKPRIGLKDRIKGAFGEWKQRRAERSLDKPKSGILGGLAGVGTGAAALMGGLFKRRTGESKINPMTSVTVVSVLKDIKRNTEDTLAENREQTWLTRKGNKVRDFMKKLSIKQWKAKIMQGLLRVKTMFTGMITKFMPMLTSLGPMLSGFMGMMPKILPLIAKSAGIGVGVAGIAYALHHAHEGVKKAREWHNVKEGEEVSTSQKVTAGLGGFLGGTKSGLAGAIAGTAKGAAIGASIGSIVPGFGTAIGAAVGAVAGGLLGAVGGKNISKGLQFVWDGTKKLIKGAWEFIKFPFVMLWKLIKKAKNWIMEKYEGMGENQKGLISAVIGFITWPYRMLWEGIKKTKDLLFGAIGAIFSPIETAKKLKKIFLNFDELTEKWAESLKTKFSSVWEKVKGFSSKIVDFITWPFHKMMEILSSAKDWMNEQIQKIPGIGRIFKWMSDKKEETGLKPKEGGSSWYNPFSWGGDKKETSVEPSNIPKSHSGAIFTGSGEYPTMVKGGEMVIAPDNPQFGRAMTDVFMETLRTGLIKGGPSFKESGPINMAGSEAIAHHEASMEMARTNMESTKNMKSNKDLKDTLEKVMESSTQTANIVNNMTNNINTANNATVANTSSVGFDDDTEKILGGRL